MKKYLEHMYFFKKYPFKIGILSLLYIYANEFLENEKIKCWVIIILPSLKFFEKKVQFNDFFKQPWVKGEQLINTYVIPLFCPFFEPCLNSLKTLEKRVHGVWKCREKMMIFKNEYSIFEILFFLRKATLLWFRQQYNMSHES